MIARVRHHEAEHPHLPGQLLRCPGDLAPDVEHGGPGLHREVPEHEGSGNVFILRDNHRQYRQDNEECEHDEKPLGGDMERPHEGLSENHSLAVVHILFWTDKTMNDFY